jgi:DNA-binding response OmpR family regulator
MSDYRILIADYEPRAIERLREPLEKAGYQVEIAKDGLKAIQAFNAFKPHLTLIEAMLPKKHGFEVCSELKKTQHGSATPIVIVTSVYKGRRYRTQALHNYGCDEYLEKPIDTEQLLTTVERLIGESGFAAESGATAPATKPVVAVAPPPVVAPTTPAAPAAEASPATPEDDDAEFEIMERLDELLGDAPAATPSKIEKP